MGKSENQKVKTRIIAMRIKPGTELHRVYSTLASEYDTDSDLLKDGLWALIEKKYPEKMDVKMIEKKVLIKE